MKNWQHRVLYGLTVLFSLYFIYRAWYIPVTHDEAGSWINFRHFDLWSCLHNEDCWKTANNHWLNSFLFQITCSLFGESPFALRLPNLLAGISYLILTVAFVKKFVQGSWAQIAAWMILCVHLYMTEFFSLARGYGLMVTFIFLSVYFLFQYIQKPGIRLLALHVLASGFAVASNFTSLIPVAGMGIAWILFLLMSNEIKFVWKHGWIWIVFLMLLTRFTYFPVHTLYEKNEFAYGVHSWWEMCMDFFYQFADYQLYFSRSTPIVLFILYCFFLIVYSWFVFVNKNKEKNRVHILAILLAITTPSFIAFYTCFLNGAAPESRKSIFFYPLLCIAPVLVLSHISFWRIKTLISLIVILFVTNHIIRVVPRQYNFSHDWWFDEKTYALFKEIDDSPKPVKLGCSWQMQPGLLYYKIAHNQPIEGLEYSNPLVIDTSMLYYYVVDKDTVGLTSKNYVFVKQLGANLLYKRESR